MEKKDEFIAYRIKRAEETYEEALFLIQKNSWNTIVNRLYYSCFYAVMALLLKNNIKATTHRGIQNQFGIHFIKTGKIKIKYGKLYSLLFDYRLKGDYGDMFDFTEDQVLPLIDKVSEFLTEIKNHTIS